MTQEIFPEIQAATEALKTRIALTETEVAQMKDGIKAKRELLRSWRKALSAFSPKRVAPKKRAEGFPTEICRPISLISPPHRDHLASSRETMGYFEFNRRPQIKDLCFQSVDTRLSNSLIPRDAFSGPFLIE